jgi:hypothetical protein
MHPRHLLLVYPQQGINPDIKQRLALTATRSSGNLMLWVSEAPPADVAAALAELLASGVVRSAALVSADIPDQRLWVAHEWSGAFVVDRDLAELLARAPDTWVEDSSYEEFRILRPRRLGRLDDAESSSPWHVETAREYASAIADDRAVLADTTLAAVRGAMGEWFRDLADPRVGGAFALLALSGATSDSTAVALRSPAALGLRVAASAVSLPSHVRAGRLVVRGYGYSRDNAQAVAAAVPEMSLASAETVLRDGRRERAPYGVLLVIEATVDPEVEIEEGSIFEQVSMNGVQTLAAAAPKRLTVRPGTFAPLAVPAWCLNSSLAAPAGEQVRPTPLALIVQGRSQDEVWAERRHVLARSAP